MKIYGSGGGKEKKDWLWGRISWTWWYIGFGKLSEKDSHSWRLGEDGV